MEERKKKELLDGVLGWLRDSSPPNPKGMDDPTIQALANLADIPAPKGKISSKQKKNIVDKATEWARKNNPKPKDVDDPTLMQLAKVAGLDLPKFDLSTIEKANALDDALDWFRGNEPDFTLVDDFTLGRLVNLAGVSLPHKVNWMSRQRQKL